MIAYASLRAPAAAYIHTYIHTYIHNDNLKICWNIIDCIHSAGEIVTIEAEDRFLMEGRNLTASENHSFL